ncbi:MAG: hypothetical protein KAS30_00770, partial [Candidatus Diapherotrites archaeon]|nr:hypothetical protein [Candidatus Diapherotrites archaeon]
MEKRTLETKNAHSRFKSEDLSEISDVVLARLNELLGKNNDWFEASNTLFTSPKKLLENFEEKIWEIDVLKKRSEKTYSLEQDNYLSSSIIDLRLALRKVLVLKESQEKVTSDMVNIESKARQAYELRLLELERLVEELSFEKSNGVDETNEWLIKFAEKELRRQKENVNGSRASPLGLRVKILVDSAVEIERVKEIVLDPSTSSLREVENTTRFVEEVKRNLIALEISKSKKEPMYELLYSAESSLKKAKSSAGTGNLESASRKALESLSVARNLFELIKIEFELVSRPVFEKHKKLRVSIKSIDFDMFEEVNKAIELSDKVQLFVASNSRGFDLSANGKISEIQTDLLEIESILSELELKSSEVISLDTRKKWLFLTKPIAGEVVDSRLVLFFSNPFGMIENLLLSVESPNPYSQISNESLKNCTQNPEKTYFLDNKINLFFEELPEGNHSCSIDFSFVPAVVESERYLIERATNESANVKLLFDVNAKDDFEELWIRTNFDLSDLTEASFEKINSNIKISKITKGLQSRMLTAKLINPVSLRFFDPKVIVGEGDCVEASTEILMINDTGFDLKDIKVHFDLPYSSVKKASLKSLSAITGFDYFGVSSNNVFFVLKSLNAHSVSKAEYLFCFDSSDQAKEENLDELEEKIN